MKIYTIKKRRFLQWYFEDGQDTEIKSLKEEVLEKLLSGLFENNTATVTTEDVFNNCNKGAIRLAFLEEFEADENNYDTELSDLQEEYAVILID